MLTSKFISSGQLPLLRTSCILNISTSVAQKHLQCKIYKTELSSSSSHLFKILQTRQLLLYHISYPDHQHHHQQESSSQKLGVGLPSSLSCANQWFLKSYKIYFSNIFHLYCLSCLFLAFVFVRELGNRLFYLCIYFLGRSPQCVDLSSPTRDRTHVPCIGSMES